MRKRVLFLCTHNSARSQMAERLLRHTAGDRFEVASAGTEQTRVHPVAIEAMREIGIDISNHTSKTLDAFQGQKFEYVITVCDRATESCPVFPGGTERIHWSFDDPSAAAGTDEEKLRAFRTVRRAIQQRLRIFLTVATKPQSPLRMPRNPKEVGSDPQNEKFGCNLNPSSALRSTKLIPNTSFCASDPKKLSAAGE